MKFTVEKFIIESCAIDGIDCDTKSPYYIQHLLAYKFLLNSKIREIDILWAHRFLMDGLLEKPGEYRDVQVAVGPHVPKKVPGLMRDFCRKKYHTRADCWNLHCLFETIHPFVDGNGRIGRCILNAMMVQIGEEPMIIRARYRHKYYADLEKWRRGARQTSKRWGP